MKKKKVNKSRDNKFNDEPHLFYPKEFWAYILITGLLTLISLPTGIMVIALFIMESSKFDDPFIIFTMLVLGILSLVISIYFIITIIELIRKIIYVEVNKNHIKIKRFYVEKLINIWDIKYISKVSQYRNTFDYSIVGTEARDVQRNKKIVEFPTVWFSGNDVLKMVELLRTCRPSIEISGFYPKVSRVRYTKKRKKWIVFLNYVL